MCAGDIMGAVGRQLQPSSCATAAATSTNAMQATAGMYVQLQPVYTRINSGPALASTRILIFTAIHIQQQHAQPQAPLAASTLLCDTCTAE
jgi:hypothetical protein